MNKLTAVLPWISLSASTAILVSIVNISALLPTLLAITLASTLVAIREVSESPIAIAISKGFAIDIGGFLAPLVVSSVVAAYSTNYLQLLFATAAYSTIAATIARPSRRSISVNTIAYSVPTTLALLFVMGRSAALCIPLASLLGVFLYVDVAYYLALYRDTRRTFIAGGAGALDALVVSPAISTCTALAFLSVPCIA